MTEFTPQFILEQKEFVKGTSPLPWHACTCGKCGMVSNQTDLVATATRGNWGDDYPDLRRVGGSIEGKFETFMNQITYGNVPPEIGNANAKYIEQACNNYPDALDEILRLQAEIELLQINRQCLNRDFAKAQERVQELEQERRWIPVSERLPEDTKIYDVAIAGYPYSWTGSCVFGKWIGESGKTLLGITHWKYRLQPPQEEE